MFEALPALLDLDLLYQNTALKFKVDRHVKRFLCAAVSKQFLNQAPRGPICKGYSLAMTCK